jgi:hypothetical protein
MAEPNVNPGDMQRLLDAISPNSTLLQLTGLRGGANRRVLAVG